MQKYSLLLAHSPVPSCLYPMFWAQNVTFVTKETCKREKRYIIIWKIKDNFVAEIKVCIPSEANGPEGSILSATMLA